MLTDTDLAAIEDRLKAGDDLRAVLADLRVYRDHARRIAQIVEQDEGCTELWHAAATLHDALLAGTPAP